MNSIRAVAAYAAILLLAGCGGAVPAASGASPVSLPLPDTMPEPIDPDSDTTLVGPAGRPGWPAMSAVRAGGTRGTRTAVAAKPARTGNTTDTPSEAS
jgi:hypothetical protein